MHRNTLGHLRSSHQDTEPEDGHITANVWLLMCKLLASPQARLPVFFANKMVLVVLVPMDTRGLSMWMWLREVTLGTTGVEKAEWRPRLSVLFGMKLWVLNKPVLAFLVQLILQFDQLPNLITCQNVTLTVTDNSCANLKRRVGIIPSIDQSSDADVFKQHLA
jgi:hypothetical protein